MYVFKLVNRTLFISALDLLGTPKDVERKTGIKHYTVSNWLRQGKEIVPNSKNLEIIFKTCKEQKVKVTISKEEKIVTNPQDIGLEKEYIEENTIERNLKYLLTLNHMQQKDLAKKTAISNTQISRLMHKKAQKNIEQLVKIANVFNVSLDFLVTGKDKNVNNKNYTNFNLELNTIKKIDNWTTTDNIDKNNLTTIGKVNEMEILNLLVSNSDFIETFTSLINKLIDLGMNDYYGLDYGQYKYEYENTIDILGVSIDLCIEKKISERLGRDIPFPPLM